MIEGILQEALCKDQCQCDHLHSAHGHLQDLRERQEYDDQVGQNGRHRVCNPPANQVDAVSGKAWLPQLLHRGASEDEEKCADGAPKNHESADRDQTRLFKPRQIEDAVVHEEEGHLRQADIP